MISSYCKRCRKLCQFLSLPVQTMKLRVRQKPSVPFNKLC